MNDQINERLKSAISLKPSASGAVKEESTGDQSDHEDDDGIITTAEEIEGFNIVKAIVRTVVDASRVIPRDTKSYFGVLLDDNNRKPICRLHFNRTQKYIGILDEEKKEVRHPITSLDEIFNFSDDLIKSAESYL